MVVRMAAYGALHRKLTWYNSLRSPCLTASRVSEGQLIFLGIQICQRLVFLFHTYGLKGKIVPLTSLASEEDFRILYLEVLREVYALQYPRS